MRSVIQTGPRPAALRHLPGGGQPGPGDSGAVTAGSACSAGALIVVMTYFPLVFVVSNSLKTGQNIFSSGVFSLFTQFDYQNYSTAWSGVSRPLFNTIIVAAASVALGVTAAALGAYAFSQLRFRGKELLFLAYLGAAADPVDADPDPAVPDHPETAPVQHLVGADPAVRGHRPAAAGADLPRLLRPDPAGTAGKRPHRRLHRTPGAARGSSSR